MERPLKRRENGGFRGRNGGKFRSPLGSWCGPLACYRRMVKCLSPNLHPTFTQPFTQPFTHSLSSHTQGPSPGFLHTHIQRGFLGGATAGFSTCVECVCVLCVYVECVYMLCAHTHTRRIRSLQRGFLRVCVLCEVHLINIFMCVCEPLTLTLTHTI